ncbi:hypothetical protein PAGU2196_53490 [Pseudomonas sp. PAGU 2196]|uniref:hypothetical protein n=1 Tax=Pseudomonas sp. PAGU 2196 TaxID=2793997 RepID=UPI001EE08448|nr:hypothetical protein [Pseudomonas sp. PAGU 2196]GHS84515.1 hypothetical protein PAGU2196_53490 [Pseudomonas sp. PAGU 2196]
MADTYPILPLSVLDELSHLNGALSAFDELMTAWLAQTMRDGPAGDRKHFPAGVHSLLRPIIEGYQRIASEGQSFREAGLRVTAGTVCAGPEA